VLFINNGVHMLRTGKERKLPEWLGFTGLREVPQVPLERVIVSQPRHPFLAHLPQEGKRPWMGGGYVTTGLSAGQVLIDLAGDGSALLYIRAIGKGQVVHYGRQTFRYRGETLESLPGAVRRKKFDQEQARTVERAIFEQQRLLRAIAAQWPNLLTARDVLKAGAAELHGVREGLFAWYREPDRDRDRWDEPTLFHDPSPRSEEQLQEIALDVGRNEYESFFFYLTNFGQ